MLDTGYGCALRERRRDLFFVLCFVIFAGTSFLFDVPKALGSASGVPARGLEWYVRVAGDRLFAEAPGPVGLWVALSGFVYGPFYLVLVYAFWYGANFVRAPALVWAGAMILAQASYLYWALVAGPHPANPPVFLALNLPYLLVPLFSVVRLWQPNPFGEGREAEDFPD